MVYSLTACAIGFILDLILGDPSWLYHPVRLIGKLIEISERVTRKSFPKTKVGELRAGLVTVIVVCTFTTLITFLIIDTAYKFNIFSGIFIESMACYFFLATKSLRVESMRVYKELEKGDLQGARVAVGRIVGRDTENLSAEGVTKAAVETVAENLSDGVIGPLFYMLIGGGTMGAFYKAVNTLDSMIGYKNDKYLYFGRFGARLDDIVNFIPSRLSALMMILATLLLGKDTKNAIKIFKQDRFNHASINSAQTESVCAGALRIQLAGDAYYFGKLCKKPYIGDALENVRAENIKEANSLMYLSAVLALIFLGGIKLIIISLL